MATPAETSSRPSGADARILAGLRAALACSVGAAIVIGLANATAAAPAARKAVLIRDVPIAVRPADARRPKMKSAANARNKRDGVSKQPFGDIPKGPLQLVVSIPNQRVTLYSSGVRVAQAPVSTGTPSHPTPSGVFSIIQKDRFHRSNLYGNAPMFYMQRLTWSGVAMHEGVLPGAPASHGCIRLPHDFASKLWVASRLGARVIVARHDVAPVDFEHPKLFVPKAKPAEQPVADNEAGKRADLERPIQVAEAPSSTGSDAIMLAWATGISSNAAKSPAPAARPDPVKPVEPAKPAENKPAETTPAFGAPPLPATLESAPLPPLRGTSTDDRAKPGNLDTTATTPAAKPPRPAATPMPATASANAEASTPASNDPAKPAADELIPALKPMPLRTKADDIQKRSGHVAVFISRKEKRIYVRHGFVPLFDMPVEIERPDQAWGTHVFTALEFKNEGAGMRWNLLSMPPELPRAAKPSPKAAKAAKKGAKQPPKPAIEARPQHQITPAQALEHIKIPQEALDRIGEILAPNASLVISDYGLGSETGRYTDFIVLTR